MFSASADKGRPFAHDARRLVYLLLQPVRLPGISACLAVCLSIRPSTSSFSLSCSCSYSWLPWLALHLLGLAWFPTFVLLFSSTALPFILTDKVAILQDLVSTIFGSFSVTLSLFYYDYVFFLISTSFFLFLVSSSSPCLSFCLSVHLLDSPS